MPVICPQYRMSTIPAPTSESDLGTGQFRKATAGDAETANFRMAIPSRIRVAYSARSASTGFKDDARRAGSMLAIKAHIARIAATEAKVEASDGFVP